MPRRCSARPARCPVRARWRHAAREMAVDQAHDYMDRTETYVRNEPWKAIGIAALAGAVVGVLLARR